MSKKNVMLTSLLEDNTITVIVKHKGKTYASGHKLDISDDRALHNTLVDLEKDVFALQKTIFHKLAGKPEDLMFDLEADEKNWIVKRLTNAAHVEATDNLTITDAVREHEEKRKNKS